MIINKIKSTKAQALVILLIFMAISLLLVTSASFSAIKTTEVVRRNVNFQSSFDKAESLIDQIAVNIDSGNTQSIIETDVTGTVIGKADVTFKFGDYITVLKDNSVNIDVDEQRQKSGLNDGATGVFYCVQNTTKPAAYEITKVFKSGSTYSQKKQFIKCALSSYNFSGVEITGMESMDSANTSTGSVPGELVKTLDISPSGTLVMVKIRSLINDSQLKLNINEITGTTVAGTSKYVIVSSGIASDGSASSTITVEKPAGFYTPDIFNYVLYQGN